MSASTTNDSQFGWSSEIVSGQPVNLPPPFGLSLGLSISGENPNQSSFGQHVPNPVFGQAVLTLTLRQPTQKPDNIEARMPKKLNHPDHYTKPTIQGLAAKERAEPGYCGRVKDFIFGRTGVGSVRFLGETDVRGVDLESCIQFFKGRVNFSRAKWPVDGQGLGTAEFTLVKRELWCKKLDIQALVLRNIKIYKNILEDKGLEFVSYDPIFDGEIKFRVKYISGSGVIQFIKNASLAQRNKWSITRMLNGFFFVE